ncbi:MAG: FMN-binding protein [Candidatus Krumholzibacteria bacterium]|nr:FMN-binding protein [Candidatus Krumholzibacteria bacterium]
MKSVRIILFLVITSSLCTLLLAGAQLGYEKASAVFNVRLYGTILELFSIEAAEDDIEKVFLENFETRTIGSTVYYISKTVEKGSVVFKTIGAGLWSQIELLLAFSPDFEKMYGLRVISQAETPGLGARITEMEFLERFRGVEVRPELKVVKFASRPNEVDAITGASVTSRSVEKIINRGVIEMDQAFGRDEGEE